MENKEKYQKKESQKKNKWTKEIEIFFLWEVIKEKEKEIIFSSVSYQPF